MTTLHYEFFKEDSHHRPDTSRPIVINVPALHKLPDGEYDILRQLVLRYDVPEQHRWAVGGSCMTAWRGIQSAF